MFTKKYVTGSLVALALGLLLTPLAEAGRYGGPTSDSRKDTSGPITVQMNYVGGSQATIYIGSGGGTLQVSVFDATTGDNVASGVTGQNGTVLLSWTPPKGPNYNFRPYRIVVIKVGGGPISFTFSTN